MPSLGEFLMGDWSQWDNIDKLKERASRDKMEVIRNQVDIEELTKEVGELKLVVAALTRYLINKKHIDYQEFKNLMDAVDGLDGERDGKFSGSVKPKA